jgi:hypothetical protein
LKTLNQPLAFSARRLPTRRLDITDQFGHEFTAEAAVSVDMAMGGKGFS